VDRFSRRRPNGPPRVLEDGSHPDGLRRIRAHDLKVSVAPPTSRLSGLHEKTRKRLGKWKNLHEMGGSHAVSAPRGARLPARHGFVKHLTPPSADVRDRCAYVG
jgi:hypothetical protein